MNYISVRLYRKILEQAKAEGAHDTYFKDLPFPLDDLEEVKAVPADAFFELHERFDALLGPGFSVRVGQQMKMDDYGVLGLSWKTCSWAGEIFARSERYFKLLSDTYLFRVEEDGDRSHICLLREPYRRGVELSNEATFSAALVVMKEITETDMAPIEVSFRHSPPESLTSHQAAFGCPLLFNQPQYKLTYRSDQLRTRTAKADFSIHRFLTDRVEEETRGMQISANKIALDLKQLIKDALPSGIPGISQFSRHMGMSNRTLTRRLSESGLTFRELISKTQLEISSDLLKNTSRSIGEIAYETGFSEQSAFNRAFKRWTGLSPLEFRKLG